MIQLKNVSKFYYSKGMIASGFSRVNLEFHVGEFVVITGESGSGKTTLLNVISGLDSYEEGELYIEGKETSHYLAADFEEYRKNYIGNIFQNFNLIGSYTVYQNVELILRINGYKKDEIRKKVPAIIERVGLSKYAKTKVSKLSGGQKQRVSIARALAKDTAIVVADEPTGNLDSKSAEGIVQLLSEISKEKLVIVVTHNYDQFAPYATRTIKMHDGKVVEDKKQMQQAESARALPQRRPSAGNMSGSSKIRLGLRNTFNIFPKFILLLVVFLFVVLAVCSEYTSLKNSQSEAAKMGYNDYFNNYSEERVILKKKDGRPFTEEEIQKLRNTANVKSLVKEDIMLDYMIYIEDKEFAYQGYPCSITDFKGELEAGRMPEKNNEILMTGSPGDYYFEPENRDQFLGKTYTIAMGMDYKVKLKITGIAYEDTSDNLYYYRNNFYMPQQQLKSMVRQAYGEKSQIATVVNKNALQYDPETGYYRIIPNSNVEKGQALVSEELNLYYENGNAAGKEIRVKTENLFYKKACTLKIAGTYNKKNFTSKTGLKRFEDSNEAVYINKEDYKKLFTAANYQISVYVEDVKEMEQTLAVFDKLGYEPLALKDTLVGVNSEMMAIIQVPMTVFLVIAVFFIAYFVIQLILRSRASYFSILRMLGLAKKSIRRILDIELFTVLNIAYGLFLAGVLLLKYGSLQAGPVNALLEYMGPEDYVILYGVLAAMSYLISGKFARKLFKKTAMGSYREEE